MNRRGFLAAGMVGTPTTGAFQWADSSKPQFLHFVVNGSVILKFSETETWIRDVKIANTPEDAAKVYAAMKDWLLYHCALRTEKRK